MLTSPIATVVIATRGRLSKLRETLRGIALQVPAPPDGTGTRQR